MLKSKETLWQIRNKISSKAWYKYFFKKKKEIKFESVKFPNVNRKFK